MTDCILTTHGRDRQGYGQVYFPATATSGRRVCKAHRLAYAKANGLDVFKMGGVVMHSCDNPPCVNPEHLTLGTIQDNVADRVRKGRTPCCENQSGAKLTNEQALWVRANYRFRDPVYSATAMAARLGVSKSLISGVLTGRSWKRLP